MYFSDNLLFVESVKGVIRLGTNTLIKAGFSKGQRVYAIAYPLSPLNDVQDGGTQKDPKTQLPLYRQIGDPSQVVSFTVPIF